MTFSIVTLAKLNFQTILILWACCWTHCTNVVDCVSSVNKAVLVMVLAGSVFDFGQLIIEYDEEIKFNCCDIYFDVSKKKSAELGAPILVFYSQRLILAGTSGTLCNSIVVEPLRCHGATELQMYPAGVL